MWEKGRHHAFVPSTIKNEASNKRESQDMC